MSKPTQADDERTCPHCRKRFTPRHGSQRYCTNRKDGPGNCQKLAEQEREKQRGYRRPKVAMTCHHCGTEFMGEIRQRRPGSHEHYYCSHRCYSDYRSWGFRKRFATDLKWNCCKCCGMRWLPHKGSYGSKCPQCHPEPLGPFSPVPKRSNPRRWIQGDCQRCGLQFIRYSFNEKLLPCCEDCVRRLARERRRAAKANVVKEPYRRDSIFDRDNWICQLCGGKTQCERQVPHPKAPTIDHIVPLAEGGPDTPSNLQTACFVCNSRKGDRGIARGEQLRLAV